jgi:hypothetical protein
MNRSCRRLLGTALIAGLLPSCAPVALQPPTSEEQQESLHKERFQARIRFFPGAPQAISGFFRIGRAYSSTMGTAAVVSRVGNPRDLDMIIDTINEYTQIHADFAPDLPYSDPRLLDLPIIIPQSLPNEVELEQLTRYILEGGFVLDPGLGTDIYREGLEKYGGLVWGQDAWEEILSDDHPIFSSFFTLGNVRPSAGQAPPRGLLVHGRLVLLDFETLGMREATLRPGVMSPSGEVRGPVAGVQQLSRQLTEELVTSRVDRFSDFRFQQMVVNVVVYALTQEGSIAWRNSVDGGGE